MDNLSLLYKQTDKKMNIKSFIELLNLDGFDWAFMLKSQPQLAEHCDWSKLTGRDWSNLLKAQPQFAEFCFWNKLDDDDWKELIGTKSTTSTS